MFNVKTIFKKPLLEDKKDLYGLLAVLSVFALISANCVTFKTEDLGLFICSAGNLMFPLSYIVEDVLAECYGFWKARKVIYLGFLLNLVFVIYTSLVVGIPPAPDFPASSQAALETVFGYTPQILLASFSAYIVGSIVNAGTVSFMKKRKLMGDSLFARLFGSTVLGQLVDSTIFSLVTFIWWYDIQTTIIITVTTWLFKVCVEFFMYPVTCKVVNAVKKEYNID